MRQVIGAVAAAMLLATGCAHQRETTTQAETRTAPQASVDATMRGGAASVPGMDCEVISPTASTRSQSKPSEIQVGDVATPSFEAPDTDVSGTAQNDTQAQEAPAVALPAPPMPPAPEAAPPAPEEAPPAVALPAPAEKPEPAPVPNAEEEDTATGGAAQEGATFEGPDMGGANGGGG